MPPATFYARPYPTEVEADRHAGRESVRLTLAQLRSEAEQPSRPLALVLLMIETAMGFVKQAGGRTGELVLALRTLRDEYDLYATAPTGRHRLLARDRVLRALATCEAAVGRWGP